MASQRLQVLHEVGFLARRQVQVEAAVTLVEIASAG